MVRLGIATLKIREESFKKVIESVYDQVDDIVAVLNLYTEVPSWIKDLPKIIPVLSDNSYGDGGKIMGTQGYSGYYTSLDDDLVVPSGYISYLKEGVDKYNGVVGFHGRIYLPRVTNFKRWAGNYRCLSNVSTDVKVNFLGSGCTMWHTDRLKFSLSDCKYPNMCDVWLSKTATEQGVPMFVLKHSVNWLTYIPPKGKTIWDQTRDYSIHVKEMQKFIK